MKIGLVLDGGGGKGAYQVGVWKAMREKCLDQYVRAVAGTSVGGLNAVLFDQGDYDLAYRLWTEEITNIRKVSLQNDLSRLIDRYIDFSKVIGSSIDCFLAAHSIGDPEAKFELEHDGMLIGRYVIGEMSYYNLRCMSERNCSIILQSCSMPKAVMLASAALPLFCNKVRIGERFHQDGGVPWGGDNSPVYPIAWGFECDTILVIHLNRFTNIEKELYPDMNILEIIPNVSKEKLGFFNGTLNFDSHYAAEMIEAGYRDGIEAFREYSFSNSSHTMGISKKRKLDKEDFTDLQKELHTWRNPF